MKNWDVTVPIAGHAVVTVEANSEDEAIDAALDVIELKHIESWEALRQLNKGNFCFCPTPWEAEAQLAFGEDDEEEGAA